MGTEILPEDEGHIKPLAKSLKEITEYRANLAEYLKNRIVAIAPKDEAPTDN
jgi:RNA processing factor Prp31